MAGRYGWPPFHFGFSIAGRAVDVHSSRCDGALDSEISVHGFLASRIEGIGLPVELLDAALSTTLCF